MRIVFVGIAIFLWYLATYMDWYKKIFISSTDSISLLENIWVSQTINHYKEILWEPKFFNDKVSEYIFEKDKFYVQAIVDEDNIVQFFSITAKEPIKIKNILWTDITLCKSNFSDIDTWYRYRGKWWYLSNRNLEYFEIYWWDWSMGYKEHVFSYNSVSNCWSFIHDTTESDIFDNTYWTWMESTKPDEVLNKKYRENSIINTYSQSAAYSLERHYENLDFWPSYGQIMFWLQPPIFGGSLND